VRWKSSNNGNIISKDVAAGKPSLVVIWRASRVSLLKTLQMKVIIIISTIGMFRRELEK
jgi:hypothetical protein